ncbi:MAG TPA: cell surface protein SprA [Gemmatimonadaceae bacterium]|nr:cell surface protein SprA [Gemmatimonadaceae bacterium]
MHTARLLAAVSLLLAPLAAVAQETPRDTATAPARPTLRWPAARDSILAARARLALPRPFPADTLVAPAWTAAFEQVLQTRRASLWGETIRSAFSPVTAEAVVAADTSVAEPLPIAEPPSPESRVPSPESDIFGQYADLGVQFQSRIELKAEQNKNERCVATDALNPVARCRGSFTPQFDFKFGLITGGTVAERVHVNVDYDSQREFDASNNISVFYQGKPDEIIHRIEVGNVSFVPPPSRFITSGIPSGNYGVQMVGQLGPMHFRAIAAQQKGNVVRDRVYTIGDRTVQGVDREIEDFQLERRRFFWVIDPAQTFPGRFPNIDILDPNLPALALQIPAGQRPRRVQLYRYRPPTATGSAGRDINGPYAVTRFARSNTEVGPFELLRQGVDYYIDPTNLWITLVSPINRGERLAVSFTVTGPGGEEVINGSVGGTMPTSRGPVGRDTLNLLWDSEVLPGDPAFNREIRSAYRLGGEEIQRQSIAMKIVVGSGSDQEKPLAGNAETFLQLFGLAQPANASAFDVDNRLWPRVGDPNQSLSVGGTGSGRLIRDYFVIFPSLRPFADSGFVDPPNPVNDSLYRTADEDLNSQRRPPTQYRIRARYSAEGTGDPGTLALGSVQVRPNSERISIGGVALVREVDYRVDYELGQVTFLRPDTLFRTPRQLSVQYEENPLFATAPTSVLGLTTEFPTEFGQVNFTAISQSQKTTFNRPPLGFEPASSLIAGVNGNFTFESEGLTRALSRLPFFESTTASTINLIGEFATSRPQPNSAGSAYVESFEGEGGITLLLQENLWRLGSQPAIAGAGPITGNAPYGFPVDSATTLVWQNFFSVADATGTRIVQYFPQQIDSLFVFAGTTAFSFPETVLWTTLYRRSIGGFPSDGNFLWQTPGGSGRRWRSISQPLSSSGTDLSRVEQLEFYALVDTSTINRGKNPTLVFDFGDISENTVAFVPETLSVRARPGAPGLIDSTFTGRRLEGFDRLDTERDSITRSFDVAVNDRGIPPDVADPLVVRNLDNGAVEVRPREPVCVRGVVLVLPLGDNRNNCTVGNRRLDEEDLDVDGFLNFRSAQRNDERIRRFVIDLSDPALYDRIGRCYVSIDNPPGGPVSGRVCWVRFRVPFNAPTEELNSPLIRRIKSMRMTVVSGALAPSEEDITVGVARLRLVGAPWVKREDRALGGIGGTRPEGSGFVISSLIGTQDRDPANNLFYDSPPGITDETDQRNQDFQPGQIQINERSLRLLASDVPRFARAEAFFRFPEGDRNFMGYEQLRVWARGRNKGWGPQGDLQFYLKIARDGDNFYMYRTPVNEGNTRDAWLPEVAIDFRRFFALRAQLQNAFLRGGDSLACTGIDSALVVRSELPTAPGTRRFAACADGYIVYTTNPGIAPPNLAAVQELAVGMVRVDTLGLGSGGVITPADTLELWVDDIRLSGVVRDAGYAGQMGLSVVAGELGSVQLNLVKRDPHFRQLAEQPSFVGDDQVNLASSLRLDRLLPSSLGLILPLTITHNRVGSDPLFLSRSDIEAEGIPGVRQPKSTATAYSLGMRRATPLEQPVLGALLNNLELTSTYARASSTQEFQTGTSRSFTSALTYDLAARPRTFKLPGFIDRLIMSMPAWLRNGEAMRSLRGTNFRWNPSQLRLTSAYARNSDRRESFTLPVAIDGDTARIVRGFTNALRNGATIELRPVSSLSLRWDMISLLDLRDYGDTTAIVRQAARERGELFGLDIGLERERQMTAVMSLAPVVASWLRPRLDFSTTYSMLRDPNARALLPVDTLPGAETRLPRRLFNSQGLSAAAIVDVGRLISMYTGEQSRVRSIANAIQPVEVTWRRDLRSSFDGVPFTPGLGYQLPLGGIDDFRRVNGTLATSAGVTYNFGVNHTLVLPFGLTLIDRFNHISTTTWSRLVDRQARLEAEQTTFPDVSLRWSYSPAWLQPVITSIGAQAQARITRGFSAQPPLDGAGGTGGFRIDQRTKQFPLNASVVWALGGLATDVGWNHIDRREVRSGGLTEGDQDDISASIARSFPVPASWNITGQEIRARVGYSRSSNTNFFEQDELRRRITDNGRWSVIGNADTDISQNLSFSLTLSRTVNYDRNLDRRFVQNVISAILQLQFFAGQFK